MFDVFCDAPGCTARGEVIVDRMKRRQPEPLRGWGQFIFRRPGNEIDFDFCPDHLGDVVKPIAQVLEQGELDSVGLGLAFPCVPIEEPDDVPSKEEHGEDEDEDEDEDDDDDLVQWYRDQGLGFVG